MTIGFEATKKNFDNQQIRENALIDVINALSLTIMDYFQAYAEIDQELLQLIDLFGDPQQLALTYTKRAALREKIKSFKDKILDAKRI